MSHYVDLVTLMTDEDALVKALCRMGFKEHMIERHAQATNLYGYRGDMRSQKANVIVRRQYAGSASNDLGWEKVGNSYRSHISEYDQRKYNKTWQDKLTQMYNVEMTKLTCQRKKINYTEDVDQNNNPRIRIRVKG